ncbi:hypothetical protein H9P43_009151 [Blastocladiella emersonii ATCC 22665]|nr:hypothetical protein H9P43_009150 [Blastocladiella emersonii ATCC 22665]KAI9156041.1 hypothetical protein H9P43_009151 [Blastocladiella emersonii ATCC 22665]
MAKIPKRIATRSVLLAVLLATLAVAAASAKPVNPADLIKQFKAADLPKGTKILPGRYLIEFKGEAARTASFNPLARGATTTQARTLESFAKDNSLPVKVTTTYTTAFNGVAVAANEADLAKLAAAPNVKAIYPVFTVEQDPFEVNLGKDNPKKVELNAALAMTGVDRVRKELGLTGRGTKVCIIDSGVDYTHPAFTKEGMTCTKLGDAGCRVVKGYDLVGDAYNPGKGADDLVPDNDPYDCISGHGTHVAGIAAGNDSIFTGVAPEADIVALKVFGCAGERTSTSSEAMIKAMEMAAIEGCDVVNQSIGGGGSFPDYPSAASVTRLSDKFGMIFTSSHGNSGEKGLFWGGSPGQAKTGFGTGSFDNIAVASDAIEFSGVEGLSKVGVGFDDSIPNKFPVGKAFTVKASPNPSTSTNDACTPFPADYFKGTVALIRRGGCTFAVKAAAALAAGANGIIVYNNQPGALSGVAIQDPAYPLPVGYISGADGQAIHAAASNGTVTVKFGGERISVPNTATGAQPSDFSSWGMIFSSYPKHKGSYASISGTSMASPFLGGVSLLAKEQNKKITFKALQRRAQNTARPAQYKQFGMPWPVPKQGAGLINAYDLLANKVTVEPSKIELGDGNARRTQVLTIANAGDTPVTYTATHVPAVSVFGEGGVTTDKYQFSNSTARVTVASDGPMRVGPRSSISVQVTVQPDAAQLPEHWLLSGWVVLTPNEEAKDAATLRVPYLSMTGDYSTYTVIPDPKTSPFPVVSESIFGDWDLKAPVPKVQFLAHFANETVGPFTLKGRSRPVVLANIQHVNRNMLLSVYNAKTKTKLGYAFSYPFVQTGPVFFPTTDEVDRATGKPIQGWSGEYFETLQSDKVKYVEDGEYYWTLDFVTPSTKTDDDWEKRLNTYWTSPKIIVKRDGTTSTSTTTTSTSTSTTTTSTSTSTSTSTTTTTTSSASTSTTTTSSGTTTTGTSTSTSGSATETATGSATATATGTTTAPYGRKTSTTTALTTTSAPYDRKSSTATTATTYTVPATTSTATIPATTSTATATASGTYPAVTSVVTVPASTVVVTVPASTVYVPAPTGTEPCKTTVVVGTKTTTVYVPSQTGTEPCKTTIVVGTKTTVVEPTPAYTTIVTTTTVRDDENGYGYGTKVVTKTAVVPVETPKPAPYNGGADKPAPVDADKPAPVDADKPVATTPATGEYGYGYGKDVPAVGTEKPVPTTPAGEGYAKDTPAGTETPAKKHKKCHPKTKAAHYY